MYCFHPISVRKWYDPSPERYLKTSEGKTIYIKCDMPHKQSKEYHMVPCGKCVACLSRRRNEWTYRLTKEKEMSDYTYFGTLTYDNDHIPIKFQEGLGYYVFDKSDVQNYLKRVRYFMSQISPNMSCSYYVCSEYGSVTHRPHYHYVMFVKGDQGIRHKAQFDHILRGSWKDGFCTIKPASAANIHYVTKYCVKGLETLPVDCIDDVFTLSSKKPAIGDSFLPILEKQEDYSLPEPVVFNNGYRQAMPRRYRNLLGLSGLNVRQSDLHPSLTYSTEQVYMHDYLRSHKTFNAGEFAVYAQNRLNRSEYLAHRRQLQRTEKL